MKDLLKSYGVCMVLDIKITTTPKIHSKLLSRLFQNELLVTLQNINIWAYNTRGFDTYHIFAKKNLC